MKYMEKHPMLVLAVGVLGISLSSIFVRYSAAPSAVTAAWRLIWSVILLAPVALGSREIKQEFKRVDRKSLLLGGLSGVFLAIHFALWFESLQHTSVASSTTIVCTDVIWVSVGYCVFLKGKLGKKAMGTIAVMLLGSVLIALSDAGGGGGQLYGDILALLGAVAIAAYTLIGRVLRAKMSTTAYTFQVYSACAAVLVGLCLAKGQNLMGYGWNAVFIGFLLAVFSTILGHSIFSWSLKYFSPSFVSACKLCEPVGAAILAVFLFGELPKSLQLLGGGLILGGVYYYSGLERKAQEEAK
jgi:drug/metabolite transporter (DMT)-like permease